MERNEKHAAKRTGPAAAPCYSPARPLRRTACSSRCRERPVVRGFEGAIMADSTNPTDARDRPDDVQGLDSLFESTYRDLRRLARQRLRGSGAGGLLDTTALVHESYAKMARSGQVRFPDRPRFLVYAGRVMRSIIVDFARQRMTARRGGAGAPVTLTTNVAGAVTCEEQILRVHAALDELARVDERMARVVEMRYFGGLTEQEIAQALGVTDRTVRRDWEQARLFLAEALK